MTATTTADAMLAALGEHRSGPVATVIASRPGFEGDVQARLDIRTKEVRRHLEEAQLPPHVVDAVAAAVRAHAGEDGLGIVADAGGILTSPLTGIEEDDEVIQVESLPRYVPFVRDRFVHRPHVV
ncbi:MAG TPA: hypothetical protein VFK43_16745, partial [Acidimicrobiales bacterium]|nr:hypothetical protein [Acidimicrobiales bacterium]